MIRAANNPKYLFFNMLAAVDAEGRLLMSALRVTFIYATDLNLLGIHYWSERRVVGGYGGFFMMKIF